MAMACLASVGYATVAPARPHRAAVHGSHARGVNGSEAPATFRPYGTASIWNRPLPDAPRLYPGSRAIVDLAERDDGGPVLRTQEYGGGYDISHPVVFAAASDPLVSTHCRLYCNSANLPGRIHIPAKARPATGSDHHLAVIQPDGSEADFWLVSAPDRDWESGDTLQYGGGVMCGSYFTGKGYTRDAATAGGACLGGGIVRSAELRAGSIKHALFVTTACLDPHTAVFPATQTSRNCVGSGPHVPLGARIQLDLNDRQIASLPVRPWEAAILRALHHYGAYAMDGGGREGLDHTTGLLNVMVEDGAQFEAFGKADAMASWARREGWRPVNVSGATRYIGSEGWNPLASIGGWGAHLRIVDPCYARGSC